MTTTSNHSLNAHAQTGAMDNTTDPDPEVPERAWGPRRYSASYKARSLAEYERLHKAPKGGCCTARAVHLADLGVAQAA